MVNLVSIVAAAAALTTCAIVSAHPGQPHHERSLAELEQRRNFMANAKRSLEGCANSQASRLLKERAIARRAAQVDDLRRQRERQRRLDAATVLATSHLSNLTGVTTETDAATLFGDEVACILEPEVTQGPYYVSGELIRNDIREDQAGVDLYTEIQFIDVNTCEPVEALYVDFWHCNSTGVYAGVVASGNGDSTDATNVDKTFHRGLYPTDADGLVSFTTKFPGHYTGRATHIHILGSYDGEVLDNNTYANSVAASVGQLFFDQDLITQVEATNSYNTNTQELTTNADDTIFAEETATEFDPVMEYVLLGESVEDGIFAWISVGVDMTVAKSITAAATLTADGGVMNSGTSTGGGMGGGSGMGGGFPGSGMGDFPGSGMGAPGSAGGAPPSTTAEVVASDDGSGVQEDADTTATTGLSCLRK